MQINIDKERIIVSEVVANLREVNYDRKINKIGH